MSQLNSIWGNFIQGNQGGTVGPRKQKTPRLPGAFHYATLLNASADNATRHGSRSGRGLLDRAVDHLGGRRGRGDWNVAGFLGLRDLADEIDMEQAVLERSVLHDDEIGELEGALEGAGGDAAIEHLGFVLAVLIGDLLALDGQRIFLGNDGQLVLAEARHGYRNAVGVLAGALDVVGGIAGASVGGRLVKQGKETVEADGGTIKRREIVGTHG